MTDWLLLLKLSLGGVLLFDLLILQRKPAADAIVQRLDWQAELARKGTYGWLMPTAALLVLLRSARSAFHARATPWASTGHSRSQNLIIS